MLNKLFEALENSWGEDTATGGWWDPEVPSLNQCAVTALVVQDWLGGELLRCNMTDGDSHYWNRVSGQEYDFTAEQFNHIVGKPIKETVVIRDRDYVLSFPDTKKRYELLSERVARYINGGN